MSLPGFSRKEKPANIVAPANSNTSFPAGEASPVPTNGPEPVLTPHRYPRAPSSFYSEHSSISSETAHAFNEVYVPEPLRPTRYEPPRAPTPESVKSLFDACLAVKDEWEDASIAPSTAASSPSPYASQRKHTPVSEYMQERSWIPSTPTKTLAPPAPAYTPPPPPVPAKDSSFWRRLSTSSISRHGSRRLSRSPSTVTTLPFPVHIEESAGQAPATPADQTILPSTTFAGFSFRRSRSKTQKSAQASSPISRTIVKSRGRADPFISTTAYEKTRKGHSPTPVAHLHTFDHQIPQPTGADAALFRGLTQTYGSNTSRHVTAPLGPAAPPAVYPSPSYKHATLPIQRKHTTTTTTTTSTLRPSPPSAAHSLLHPTTFPRRPLKTSTRDPYTHGDQGSWLYIGTLRGPTPSGVRTIDAAMARSIEKSGDCGRGVKEVKKILKKETRGCIEWVDGYLGRRWGIGL